MKAREDLLTTLMVMPYEEHAIRIVDLLPDTDSEHFDTVIFEGETFGGRHYDEWLVIANGPGRVGADWLQV